MLRNTTGNLVMTLFLTISYCWLVELIIEMVEAFRKRRDNIVEGLNSLPGVHCLSPQGAFYVFPNITQTGWTSEGFADAILSSAGVAVVPGPIFGEWSNDISQKYIRSRKGQEKKT